MNFTKSFRTTPRDARTKKGVKFLLLLILFLLVHFSAVTQELRPKWVADFGSAAGTCTVTNLAVDKQNNIYVAGFFNGTVDFDPSAGVKNLTSGNENVFVGKYTPDGALIWAESFTGSGNDISQSLAVDKDGNVTVAGEFSSKDFDADPGPAVHNLDDPPVTGPGNPGTGTFIVHLDANGSFLWAYGIGTTGPAINNGLATDSQDDVIITTNSASPVTLGDSTYTSGSLNGTFGLIIKYNTAGTVLWSIAVNSQAQQQSNYVVGCGVDSQDNIIVSGVFKFTVNFNPRGVAYNLTGMNSNNGSAFVAKYSPDGILNWANEINGNYFARSSVAVDPQNNVYFGTIYEQTITLSSTVTLTSNGEQDICFVKYSPAGALQFAKSTQGTLLSSADYLQNFAIDKNSNLYITGYFSGTINFNPNAGNVKNLSSNAGYFVAQYDPNGNYVDVFGTGSPNCTGTYSTGIAIDTNNNVDVSGQFCSTVNFDPTSCSTDNVTAKNITGSNDGFIVQYSTIIIANNVITPPAISNFCTSATPGAITGSTPTGGFGAYVYQWQSSTDSLNFTDIAGAGSINYTAPAISATTFYRRIVSADCATPLTSNVVGLHVSSPPDAPQVIADTVCAGATATLSIQSPQAGLSYKWYAVATGDTSLFTGVSFTTPVLKATTTYYAEADNPGCSSATRTAVTVAILPILPAPVVTVGPITGTSITFKWNPVTGATGYQVSTDSGKTFSPPSSGANGLTTVISGLQPGDNVTLIVQAIGGKPCQLSAGSAAVSASIPKDDIIYVPNAFTPNGDGKNDMVHVHSEIIQSMTFYIYDQWGELLFTSTNMDNGWDGTYKGTKEPVGVYVYYLQATMIDGKKVTKNGTITLIR